MKYLILGPGMYLLCFIAGMLFKRYVLDVIKNYVINKLKPGIIQTYLEEALGLNKKQVVPPVMIMPIQPQVQPIIAAPTPLQAEVPVEQAVAVPEQPIQ